LGEEGGALSDGGKRRETSQDYPERKRLTSFRLKRGEKRLFLAEKV